MFLEIEEKNKNDLAEADLQLERQNVTKFLIDFKGISA